MSDPTPEQAFSAFQQSGDPSALAVVFDRTAPPLLLLAAHVTPDAAAAEDLLQDTFLQVIEHAGQWQSDRPLLPWLAGILRHRAQDLARRLRVRRSSPLLDADSVAAPFGGPLAAAEGDELLHRVQTALAALEPPYREALMLRLVHGLQPAEIAHTLLRPPATVRVQLKRGLDLLRGLLPAGLASSLAVLLTSGRGIAAAREAVLTSAAKNVAVGGVVSVVRRATARSSAPIGWLIAVVALVAVGASILPWSGATPPQPTNVHPPLADNTPIEPAMQRSAPTSTNDLAGSRIATTAAASTPTTLHGRCVIAGSRTPLPGGHVKVTFSRGRFVTADPEFRSWPDPIEVDAAADGSFEVVIHPEVETRVTVELSAPGYCPTSTSWPSLRSGIRIDLGDVVLVRGCRLQARAVDGDGRPMPGITIEIERRSGGVDDAGSPFGTWSSIELDSQTDGSLPPRMLPADGSYGVAVSFRQPGFHVVEPTEIRIGSEAVLTPDIVVARAAREHSVVGRVVDTSGHPVAGVTLCVEPQMLDMGAATTAADGSFWLGVDLPAGDLELHLPARERGYRLVEPGRTYERGVDVEVRVQRLPAFDVPIEVVDARSGRPVLSYGVRCEIDYWLPERRLLIPPDRIYRPAPPVNHADGRALLRGLHPGPHRLCVFPADAELATAYLVPFTVRNDGVDPVRVELHAFAPLRVSLRTDTGEPLAGVEVRLVHTMATGGDYTALFAVEQFARGVGGGLNTGVALQTKTTDASGVVELRAPVDEPRLGLQLSGPRVEWNRRSIGAVGDDGADLQFTLPALAQVRGRIGPAELLQRIGPSPAAKLAAAIVRDEDSDLHLHCPKIVLRSADGESAGSGTLLPDGTFSIDVALPGDHQLVIEHDWALNPGFYTTDELTVFAVNDLRAGEVRELDIDASSLLPARLRGTVSVDGGPWTGGKLGFVASDKDDDAHFHVDLDEHGAFDRVVRPGRYLPYAVWEDTAGDHHLFAEARVHCAVGSDETCNVSLQRRSLRIEVRRADGSVADGEVLRVQAVDFPEVHRWLGDSWRTDAAGIVVLDPAPPGRVQVRLADADGAPSPGLFGEFTAGPTAVTDVRLQLPR